MREDVCIVIMTTYVPESFNKVFKGICVGSRIVEYMFRKCDKYFAN